MQHERPHVCMLLYALSSRCSRDCCLAGAGVWIVARTHLLCRIPQDLLDFAAKCGEGACLELAEAARIGP